MLVCGLYQGTLALSSTEGEEEEVWLNQLGLEKIVSKIKGELWNRTD